MKFLLLITLSLIALNVFSSEKGEDQKGNCLSSVQTPTLAPKETVIENNTESEQAEKEVKTIAM